MLAGAAGAVAVLGDAVGVAGDAVGVAGSAVGVPGAGAVAVLDDAVGVPVVGAVAVLGAAVGVLGATVAVLGDAEGVPREGAGGVVAVPGAGTSWAWKGGGSTCGPPGVGGSDCALPWLGAPTSSPVITKKPIVVLTVSPSCGGDRRAWVSSTARAKVTGQVLRPQAPPRASRARPQRFPASRKGNCGDLQPLRPLTSSPTPRHTIAFPKRSGRVAHLDRVPASEAGGSGFESRRAHPSP
jgi:hypothetical protein